MKRTLEMKGNKMTEWTNEAILEWHKQTFPNATLETQLRKVEDELREMDEAARAFLEDETKLQDAIDETADVWISAVVLRERFESYIGSMILHVILDLLNGSGFDEDLCELCVENVKFAVNAKMDKNVKREWKETTPGYYQHKETIQ